MREHATLLPQNAANDLIATVGEADGGIRSRRYPAYRPTGVPWLGSIPTHWRTKPLRFACRLNATKGEVSHLPPDTEVSFVPMEAVGEFGGMDVSQTKPIESVLQGYTYFRDGDVVVAKITPCFENGKGSIAEGLTNGLGFGTTELHTLRSGRDFERRFLFYLTMSHEFRHQGAGHMYGAGGQKRVPESFLRDFVAPLPPLPEQQAIAGWLDERTRRIDELVAAKRRLIDRLAEQRTALITHAVTKGLSPAVPTKPSGIDWLGSVIPAHWVIHHLRRVVRVFVDYRGRTPDKTDSGVPLITAGAIKGGRIDHSLSPEYMAEADYHEWMQRGWPERGDVVITTEAPLGEVALVEDIDVAFAQRVILLKVNRERMMPEYLRYYYLSQLGEGELKSRSSGSTAAGIRADRLRGSLVVVPPLDEQAAIVESLDAKLAAMSRPIATTETAIVRLTEYRQALISAAITGKIKVTPESNDAASHRSHSP